MQHDPWFIEADIDCVDMEGWALAYVAQQYGIPFKSWKYVRGMLEGCGHVGFAAPLTVRSSQFGVSLEWHWPVWV